MDIAEGDLNELARSLSAVAVGGRRCERLSALPRMQDLIGMSRAILCGVLTSEDNARAFRSRLETLKRIESEYEYAASACPAPIEGQSRLMRITNADLTSFQDVGEPWPEAKELDRETL